MCRLRVLLGKRACSVLDVDGSDGRPCGDLAGLPVDPRLHIEVAHHVDVGALLEVHPPHALGKVVEGVDVEVHPASFLIGALVIHFAADLEAEHAPILGRVECRSAAISLGYDRVRYQLHHHVDYLLSFWGNKKAPNGG